MEDRKHVPVVAELIKEWRGWYIGYRVVYKCSCGRVLRKHGDKTLSHFHPEIYGLAKIGRELDTVENLARGIQGKEV